MTSRTLHVRLREPARRPEARRLLTLLLAAPPLLAAADPALLTAEVADPRGAVDALAELAWSGIELADFTLATA